MCPAHSSDLTNFADQGKLWWKTKLKIIYFACASLFHHGSLNTRRAYKKIKIHTQWHFLWPHLHLENNPSKSPISPYTKTNCLYLPTHLFRYFNRPPPPPYLTVNHHRTGRTLYACVIDVSR